MVLPVSHPLVDARLVLAGVELRICRLDLLPGAVTGNKAYKLLPNLRQAKSQGYDRIASFGGVWSNHLHALALGGKSAGIQTLGFVRGDGDASRSAMLCDAESAGMHLVFLSRSDYRRRHDPVFLEELSSKYPRTYWVPEGGSNRTGISGCMTLAEQLRPYLVKKDTLLAVACGTGGTLAGLAAGLEKSSLPGEVVGYAVLKGADYLNGDVRNFQAQLGFPSDNWRIETRFHGGGYARCSPELEGFILDFYQRHGVLLEPVYTGKLLHAIFQQVEAGELRDRRVIALHSGGLQGLRGYPKLLTELAEMGFDGLK